jgi:hypothetical protein
MSEAVFAHITTLPRVLAQSCGAWFVPCIFHSATGLLERFPRKARPDVKSALRYAERRVHFAALRTNEARRHLSAISDPWWVGVVAAMSVGTKIVHTPVNRDRTGFQGWGNR